MKKQSNVSVASSSLCLMPSNFCLPQRVSVLSASVGR